MERLFLKRFATPLLVASAASLAISGCAKDNIVETSPQQSKATEQQPDPHVQLYPIPTGRTDRSEVFKVITLDDGRIIQCEESHILDSRGTRSMESCWPAEPAPTTLR